MDTFWERVGSFFIVAFWVGVAALIFWPSSESEEAQLDAPSYSSSGETLDYSTDYYDSEDYYYDEPSYSSGYRSYYSSAYDKDCDDFDSWEDAQYHYENIADDNLDGDGDGIACEALY